MATTKSKKEIIDYLWEWAEGNGEWAKSLVKKVIEKEIALSADELDTVYDTFLDSIAPSDDKTPSQIERPQLTLETADLTLHSLSDVKGVNKLAEEQTLEFGNNITVIYGENASGKSGYSRILKMFGFSYEKETKVLCNVYCDEETCQNAKICYSTNGEGNEFVWDSACTCPDLQGLSVFTNNCVSISLDSKRELLVTPIGFHLFSLVSDELDKLAGIHREKISKFKKDISWLDDLHEETTIQAFLKELNPDSSEDELKKLGEFTEKNEQNLKSFQDEKRNLNKNLIQAEITSFQNQLRELRQIKSQIESDKTSFTSNDWKDLGDHLEQIEELKKKEQIGIKEIAEERGIDFYESVEFSDFIKAADKYIKKIEKEEYPKDEEEICIYCRQKLREKGARELLKNYRLLLNDPTQKLIKQNTQKISSLQTKLKNIATEITLHQPSFGVGEEELPIQPGFLNDFCELINGFKVVAETKDLTKICGKNFEVDYDEIINQFKRKIKVIDANLEAKNQTLSTIEEKEEELDKKIDELLDRKKLNQKLSEVEDILKGLKVARLLEGLSGTFSTDSISRKTSKARDDLIAESFNEIFQRELKGLRRSEIKINLKFRTDKAKSVLLQDISSDYALSDVLSEGEQKAIALAEFFTELQLEKSKAPVVVDDPVTSLDHNIIDEVARRLVALSRERQVIVFTHSILLFNSIKHKSELERFKDLEFKYYETQTDLEHTGILYESPTLKEDLFKNYKKEINNILNLPKEERDRRENELAVQGYDKLRAAIEVLIEREIFNNTVKRYRKNVALSQFEKIKGELIDKHKERLNDVFDKCCDYVGAHSSADELQTEPSLSELKMDFDEVKQIRAEFVS